MHVHMIFGNLGYMIRRFKSYNFMLSHVSYSFDVCPLNPIEKSELCTSCNVLSNKQKLMP